MNPPPSPQPRFIRACEAEVEQLPGKTHHWLSKPGFTDTQDLLVVRAILEPGEGHGFHYHPQKEEVLHFLSGTAEQWLGDRKAVLGPGDSAYIPADLVHATYNPGPDRLVFLAVITPASASGPVTVEVGHEEPWRSLRDG